jgi:hypothetical protein
VAAEDPAFRAGVEHLAMFDAGGTGQVRGVCQVRSKSIAVGMIAVIVARFAVVLTLNTLGQIRCGRRLFGENDQYWSLSTVVIDSR